MQTVSDIFIQHGWQRDLWIGLLSPLDELFLDDYLYFSFSLFSSTELVAVVCTLVMHRPGIMRGRIRWKWTDPENLKIFIMDRRIMYQWFRSCLTLPLVSLQKTARTDSIQFAIRSFIDVCLQNQADWYMLCLTSVDLLCHLPCSWTFLYHLKFERLT
jgi:hypothetical protein